jgi:hypothetical protein
VDLSLHASDKLQAYGIEGERFQGWQTALHRGEPFLDVSSGASGLVISWEGRPWVVILSNSALKLVTTYPTDERTVANRRGGGLWIFPNN